MATGDKLVNLDELKLVYDKLHVPSVQVQIPTGQWSGSSTRTYTVNATNVTADTIIDWAMDSSINYLKADLTVTPGSGTIQFSTTAIPAGTINVTLFFPGVKGEVVIQTLADVYSKSQVDQKIAQSTAIMDVSSGITAVAAYVDTSAQLELRARKQLNIVAFQFSFRASAASTSGQAILTGLPPALVNSYQFVAMNITTQKPITMAVMANGALAFWYSENGFSAGDRIRGSVTYICA